MVRWFAGSLWVSGSGAARVSLDASRNGTREWLDEISGSRGLVLVNTDGSQPWAAHWVKSSLKSRRAMLSTTSRTM